MPYRLLGLPSTAFDPRSIFGCICNLDASVLSSLKQNSNGTTDAAATNDPVGYWADLSGLGNHAAQSVATGSRPLLRLNNQNHLAGLLFDGSNDFLTATVAGFRSLTATTVIQVVKPTPAAVADTQNTTLWGFGNLGVAGGGFPQFASVALYASSGVIAGERMTVTVDTPATNNGRLGASLYSREANTAQFLATALSTAGTSFFANNSRVTLNLANVATITSPSAPSSTGYTLDNHLHIGAVRANGSMTLFTPLTMHQMIVYNRLLTAAEMTTIWHAMRMKWGIQ